MIGSTVWTPRDKSGLVYKVDNQQDAPSPRYGASWRGHEVAAGAATGQDHRRAAGVHPAGKPAMKAAKYTPSASLADRLYYTTLFSSKIPMVDLKQDVRLPETQQGIQPASKLARCPSYAKTTM
ncbi:MAG TPA: hypothetical protein DEP36_02105 [Gammaproteobacteria bacterium]|nr:hypothetical protein [Gammaproteobacteria bacterium]